MYVFIIKIGVKQTATLHHRLYKNSLAHKIDVKSSLNRFESVLLNGQFCEPDLASLKSQVSESNKEQHFNPVPFSTGSGHFFPPFIFSQNVFFRSLM